MMTTPAEVWRELSEQGLGGCTEASEDLNDLDLRFAEKISAEDDWEEVWEMRKKSPTPVPCLQHTLVGWHG